MENEREKLQYLPEGTELIESPLWWQEKGLRQTQSGFGSRLATQYKVRYGKRLYRVYCSIHSNIGSLFIESKGTRIYVAEHNPTIIKKES